MLMLWHSLQQPQAMQTRQKVCKSICMEGCFVFSKSPNKRNIFYSVVKGPKMKQQILKPFIDNIHRYGSGADRCIVFVHTYEQCEELFFMQQNSWVHAMHYMSPHLTKKFLGHFVVPVTCLQLVLPQVLRRI